MAMTLSILFSPASRVASTLVLVGCTTVIGMAQSVTPKSLVREEPGVYLLGADSPQFAKAIPTAFEYVRRFAALHPYSVALVNDTHSDIIAYAVRWSGEDAQGREVSSERIEQNFTTGIPRSAPSVAAQSSCIVMPISNPLMAIVNPWDSAKAKALAHQLEFLGGLHVRPGHQRAH